MGAFSNRKNITSEETTAAWTDIALQAQAMDEFYQQYPILLTPTTAATAPSIDNPLLKPEHAAQMEKKLINCHQQNKTIDL